MLLLGPLYHLMSADLRARAVREAWAMVRRPPSEDVKGGTLVCAWVSRWAHYRDVATRDPGRLTAKRELYARHAEDGCVSAMDTYFRVGVFPAVC